MVVMGLGLPEVVMVLAVIVIKVIPYIFFAVLVALVVRYLNARPRRDRERKTAHSLGEVLAEERRRCGMTQEFVAHELGVSRQAVSKWEKGTSDPSTHNLIALAELYGVDAATLIKTAERPALPRRARHRRLADCVGRGADRGRGGQSLSRSR